MTKFAGTVLEFNGNKYNLHNLLQIAATAPRVETTGMKFYGKADGTGIPPEYELKYHNGEPPEAKEVVIFKINGAYMVLHGRQFMATSQKARLLSTPALKKARFEKEEPATAERVLSSPASGAMADKMQQAFVSTPKPYRETFPDRPAIKQEQFERRVEPTVPSNHRPGEYKVQNNSLSGVRAGSSQVPQRPEDTLTHQARQQRPAGYSDMTSHQQPPRRPSLAELTRPPATTQAAGASHPTGVRPRAHQYAAGKKKP